MTDYSAIDPPEDTSPEDYHYTERRAEILQLIERKGHPWGFNYSELGRRYDVSSQQIRKDFDRLKDWYEDRIGNDAKVSSDLAYKRIVQEYMDRGEFDKARKALDSWNSWLQDTGEQDTSPDRLEHEHSGPDGGNPMNVVVKREPYTEDEDDGDE